MHLGRAAAQQSKRCSARNHPLALLMSDQSERRTVKIDLQLLNVSCGYKQDGATAHTAQDLSMC